MVQTMILYPAIDLLSGKCVRLFQGNFCKTTIYNTDPIQVANHYAEEGAEFIHVVDLDGAKQGRISQFELITKLQQETGLKIQIGGGIREIVDIKKLLQIGVSRVVLGSIALEKPQLVRAWLNEFGTENIGLAFDIKLNQNAEPIIFIEGWQRSSNKNLWDLLHFYESSDLKHVLCTDIQCDGTLRGPNIAFYQTCQKNHPNVAFQASGGIRSLNDLQELKKIPLSGAIIGTALYEKRFFLHEALSKVKSC